MFREFILQNWSLILILMAFTILLKTTVFLDKRTINRMYALILATAALAVIVFVEFYLGDLGVMQDTRLVLMAVRYSATPFIVAQIIYALVKKIRWFVFLPAIALAVIDLISIFNGVVFSLGDAGELHRGPLGYLPFIMVGCYCVFLVYILLKRSNKHSSEIIPIVFLAFAFVTGLILPFVLGRDYAQIFCVTIVIALFVYYVFSILQLTEKDALTGLLNRQAYYSAISENAKDINAVISIDMNGLKALNDTEGHAAGDEALETLSVCFMRAATLGQSVYRLGGDEFAIVCRRASEDDVKQLVKRIHRNVAETRYSCAVGYSYCPDGTMTVSEMLKESDEMMYADKEIYYNNIGNRG